MTELEGHYQHSGVSVKWNEKRIKVRGEDEWTRVKWRHVSAVRRVGSMPGHVQLIVKGHVPPGDPSGDPFSIPVASEADANRLLTLFAWFAASRNGS